MSSDHWYSHFGHNFFTCQYLKSTNILYRLSTNFAVPLAEREDEMCRNFCRCGIWWNMLRFCFLSAKRNGESFSPRHRFTCVHLTQGESFSGIPVFHNQATVKQVTITKKLFWITKSCVLTCGNIKKRQILGKSIFEVIFCRRLTSFQN